MSCHAICHLQRLGQGCRNPRVCAGGTEVGNEKLFFIIALLYALLTLIAYLECLNVRHDGTIRIRCISVYFNMTLFS